jgi:hypothetical protein
MANLGNERKKVDIKWVSVDFFIGRIFHYDKAVLVNIMVEESISFTFIIPIWLIEF